MLCSSTCVTHLTELPTAQVNLRGRLTLYVCLCVSLCVVSLDYPKTCVLAQRWGIGVGCAPQSNSPLCSGNLQAESGFSNQQTQLGILQTPDLQEAGQRTAASPCYRLDGAGVLSAGGPWSLYPAQDPLDSM